MRLIYLRRQLWRVVIIVTRTVIFIFEWYSIFDCGQLKRVICARALVVSFSIGRGNKTIKKKKNITPTTQWRSRSREIQVVKTWKTYKKIQNIHLRRSLRSFGNTNKIRPNGGKKNNMLTTTDRPTMCGYYIYCLFRVGYFIFVFIIFGEEDFFFLQFCFRRF